jgi:hypothetical protein
MIKFLGVAVPSYIPSYHTNAIVPEILPHSHDIEAILRRKPAYGVGYTA